MDVVQINILGTVSLPFAGYGEQNQEYVERDLLRQNERRGEWTAVDHAVVLPETAGKSAERPSTGTTGTLHAADKLNSAATWCTDCSCVGTRHYLTFYFKTRGPSGRRYVGGFASGSIVKHGIKSTACDGFLIGFCVGYQRHCSEAAHRCIFVFFLISGNGTTVERWITRLCHVKLGADCGFFQQSLLVECFNIMPLN